MSTATKIDENGTEVNLYTQLTYGSDEPYTIHLSATSSYCTFSHPQFGHVGDAMSFGEAATKTQQHFEQRLRWRNIEVGQILTTVEAVEDMPVGTMLVDRTDGAFYRVAHFVDNDDYRVKNYSLAHRVAEALRTSAAGRHSWGASGTVGQTDLLDALARGLEVVWVGPGSR